MIKIRDYNPNDVFDIEDIHTKSCSFPTPDYTSPTNILKLTVENDLKIVGSAFVHLTAEVGLILDKDLPRATRAKIIQELFTVILAKMEKTDLEDYHFYINDNPEFEKFLANNFNIERDIGVSLCGRIKHEQSKPERG